MERCDEKVWFNVVVVDGVDVCGGDCGCNGAPPGAEPRLLLLLFLFSFVADCSGRLLRPEEEHIRLGCLDVLFLVAV